MNSSPKGLFFGLFLFFNLATATAFGQLSVSTIDTNPYHQSYEALVRKLLVGNVGDSIFNVTYTGDSNAVGIFYGQTTIGVDSGLIMTSGNLNKAKGPNNSCSAGIGNGEPGDLMLTALSGVSTFDAAFLDYDYITANDSIYFQFVFGSEEYADYVNAAVNDVVAVFVSSPALGLAAQNIALVPGTTDPISINTVNNGNAGCGSVPTGPCENCAYYVDNYQGSSIQYDGFTIPIEIKMAVTPGVVYHVKVAIADGGIMFMIQECFCVGGKGCHPFLRRLGGIPILHWIRLLTTIPRISQG